MPEADRDEAERLWERFYELTADHTTREVISILVAEEVARAVAIEREAFDAKIVSAIVAGRAVVDECNASDGYDSMVFAEARRAWHDTIAPLGAFENEMRLLRRADDARSRSSKGPVTE